MNKPLFEKPSFLPGVKTSQYLSADGQKLKVGDIVYQLTPEVNPSRFIIKEFTITLLGDNNVVYAKNNLPSSTDSIGSPSHTFSISKYNLLLNYFLRIKEQLDLEIQPKLTSLVEIIKQDHPEFDPNSYEFGEVLDKSVSI